MKDNFIKEFCDLTNNLIQLDNFDEHEVSEYIDLQFQIWDEIIKDCKIKDKFDYYFIPSIVITTTAKSTKMGSSFNFSFNKIYGKFEFSMYLDKWINIRNLSDEFLGEFFKICDKYNVSLISDGTVASKSKEPKIKYKSTAYNLYKNYILAMELDENKRQDYSVGYFEKKWELPIEFNTFFSELKIIFQNFYKFNYLLWKVDELRIQNSENRNKRGKN